MPTIVERNTVVAELLASVTGESTQVVTDLEELRQYLAYDPDEYAVVLGPDIDIQSGSSLADSLRVSRPATSVILVRHHVDTSVLAEALRSGMREVIEADDLDSLGQAVKRAAELSTALRGSRSPDPAIPARGKILTVFSPKGGVGKTTLAVNLAIALSTDAHRVCLVDLDLGFGDVAITLQMFPGRTIADAVHLQSGLDGETLETLLTPHFSNLSALVAPVQPDARDSIPSALVGRILNLLRERFDYIVVDTAPAFDEHVLQALDETDELFLVTTLDVPTLKNLKMAAETLDLLNFPPEKRHLVLNRGDDKVGLSPQKVEETLSMTLAKTIPSSPQVASSTNSGEPIVSSLPRHPVSQAIMALARQVSTGAFAAETSTSKHKTADAPRRGLLRRNGR